MYVYGLRVRLVTGDGRPYSDGTHGGLLLHHRLVEHLLGLCESGLRGGQRLLGSLGRLRGPLLGFLEGSLRVCQRRLGGLVPLHGCGGRSLGCFQIGLSLGEHLRRRFGLRLSRRRLGLGGGSFGLGGGSLCLRGGHFVCRRVLAAVTARKGDQREGRQQHDELPLPV